MTKITHSIKLLNFTKTSTARPSISNNKQARRFHTDRKAIPLQLKHKHYTLNQINKRRNGCFNQINSKLEKMLKNDNTNQTPNPKSHTPNQR